MVPRECWGSSSATRCRWRTIVSSLCWSVFCWLPRLRPVVRSVAGDAAGMVVRAFVSGGLDYCSGLLCGVAGRWPAAPVGAECRCPTGLGRWGAGACRTGSPGAVLVISSTAQRLQVSCFCAHCTLRIALPGWEYCRLFDRRRSPVAAVGWCQDVCRREARVRLGARVNPSLDRVSGALCLSPYVTEISHVYSLRDFWRHFGLCRAAAHSDCCFFRRVQILTYLLTYV